MSNTTKNIKVVAVGESSVGKTNLFVRFVDNGFKELHEPTVNFEFTRKRMTRNGQDFCLGLWDTAGQEGFHDHLRPLAFNDTGVFLLCFAINNPAAFNLIQRRWFDEIDKYFSNSQNRPRFILVGTKLDLRNGETSNNGFAANTPEFITTEQGEALKNAIGAFKYVECSARDGIGITGVFEAVVDAVIPQVPIKKRRCIIS